MFFGAEGWPRKGAAANGRHASPLEEGKQFGRTSHPQPSSPAALLINDYPYAVIDLAAPCSCSRRGFPPTTANWRRGVRSEALMESFHDRLISCCEPRRRGGISSSSRVQRRDAARGSRVRARYSDRALQRPAEIAVCGCAPLESRVGLGRTLP